LEHSMQEQMRTDRQRREIEYHRSHAKQHESILTRPFSYAVLDQPPTRWWIAYWEMYRRLIKYDLRDKRVLVVGCGFGEDALRLAKLGARVFAFDLSPEALRLARALAQREQLDVTLDEMPAEKLTYEDDFFDVVIARDILHHVDIPEAKKELTRVSKPGALWVINEIYSHSFTELIRRNWVVERVLYPRMQRFVYGSGTPYITVDERKLSERDVTELRTVLSRQQTTEYFNFLVTRIIPERWSAMAIVDRMLLMCLKPISRVLGGRVLLIGGIVK
jgi:2-polyprenyl-3-methyl-5-hydroxy-6-metoxy-1,4-benzoquinol methylase